MTTIGLNLTEAPHGWQMSESKLKKVLGLPRKMAPDFTMAPRLVGNTLVYVVASHGRRGHRVRAVCAYCLKHVPAGRLHQHRSIHKQ